MNAIKKYWPTALHLISGATAFLDPSVHAYLAANPKLAGAAVIGVVWAELMHWLQSPRNNPPAQA